MAMTDAVEVDHLAAERAAAQFDVEEMKVAWAGSRHAVEVADRMARLVASDPVSSSPSFQTHGSASNSTPWLPASIHLFNHLNLFFSLLPLNERRAQ
jgi:hypothetical protein